MSGEGQDPRRGGIGRVRAALQSFFAGRRGRRRVVGLVLGTAAVLATVGLVRFGMRLDALRERHETGPAWAFPSRVYSDGVAFTRGRVLPRPYLQRHLDARGYRVVRAPGTAVPGTYVWRDDGIEIYLRGFLEADDPEGRGGPERVRVIIENDRVAGVARLTAPRGLARDVPEPDLSHPPRLEPWPFAMLAEPNGARRTWVPLSKIPPVVRDAVIASEDRRFRSHMGLDLRGSMRALMVNARAGEVREGASTITQQLARGLFLGRERTFARKAKEAGYALLLELFLSKDQILEMYLNSIYWGQGDTRAVAGVEEAARWYFSAPAESLKLAEAATLAGIIPAPIAYSPFRSPELARTRRDQVLADMAEVGLIDARTAARARSRPLWTRRGTTRVDRFPDVMSAADLDLDRVLPTGAPRRWGLEILTTIDLAWQLEAERGVREGLAALDPGSLKKKRSPLQGAFVALRPGDGAIVALVGGRAQRPGDYNRALQAKRQTGSAIKPLVYAVALDPTRGEPLFTLRSRVPDLPKTFRARGVVWTPANSDGSYHASLSLPEALARSANVATANLVEAMGPEKVARGLEKFGLGKLKPVLSIGLGSNETSLVDLVNAYAVIGGAGLRHRPHVVRAAVDAEGRNLVPTPDAPVRVIPAGVATLTRSMLETVVESGISRPLRWAYGFDRPVGGKTGTTNDYKDAWWCGITPELAAGTWCGYDRPRSLGRAAAGVAMPVWAKVMGRMLDGFPHTPFVEDVGVVHAVVDARTESLARGDCPWKADAAFVAGTVPDTCRVNHRADWDAIVLERVTTDSLAAIDDTLLGTTLRLQGAPPFARPRPATPAVTDTTAR